MNIHTEALFSAFSNPLIQDGLKVFMLDHSSDDRVDLRAVVMPKTSGGVRDADSWVARFQASQPDYIAMTLRNGAHFWELEWSQENQLNLADEYASITLAYLDGEWSLSKSFFGRSRFTAILKDAEVEARGILSEGTLKRDARLFDIGAT